jgi:hypothetical protein
MEKRYREVKATKNLKVQAQRACLHLGKMEVLTIQQDAPYVNAFGNTGAQ